MDMNPWIYPVLFLYGLAFGSFLNVCIYRLPLEQSLWARSRCPHCRSAIRFYDNIPVLSYLVLRGKCRSCHEPVSLRYPLVELTTGLLFLATVWAFDLDWPALVNCCFLCMILVLMLIDFDHKILPNIITLPGVLIGLLLSPLQDPGFFMDRLTLWLSSLPPLGPGYQGLVMAYTGSLLGILVGGGMLWLVAEIYFRMRKVEGLGFGDVKMMAMVGAFLGWRYALLTIFLGSVAGSIVGIAIIKLQHKDFRFEMPFGTFLGLGAGICVFFGQMLLDWYLQFY